MSIKNIKVTSVNTDAAKDSLNNLGVAVENTAASINKLNTQINNSKEVFNAISNSVKSFNDALSNSNVTVEQVRSQIASLGNAMSNISVTTNNASQSYKNLGLSYKGVNTDISNTSQSILNVNSGFRTAEETSRLLGTSLTTIGVAGASAGASMTSASTGVNTYSGSTVGAVGSTLSLEQGISKLVDIMSKESNVNIKIIDQLKIKRAALHAESNALGDYLKELDDYINKERASLSGMQKGTAAYKQREKATWQLANQYNELQHRVTVADQQIVYLNSSINSYGQRVRRASENTITFNNSIEQTTNNINRNGSSLGRSTSTFNGFTGVLKRAFAYFSAYQIINKFFDVIKGGVDTIRQFTKEVSRLSAITGLPKASEEMKRLESNAISLGRTTEYTAKQIVELQVELAKLGLREREILDSTKSISAAATAMGASLAETAKLGATTMKAFGLESSDMDQIMGALAESTTKSALSFNYLTTALPYAATAGSALGFELEDILALLSSLSDAGFKASQAGTGLRNIFSKLADETKKLGKELGPIRNLDDLVNGLDELAKAGVDLGKAFELTDARAMNQFMTLVKNRRALKELSNDYKETGGVLDEMREKQLDNFDGAVTKLSSAWDGLMLSFKKSDGVLKGVVEWMAKLVNKMTEARESAEEYAERVKDEKFDELYKGMESAFKSQMETIKQGYDLQHQSLKENLDKKLITEKEYNAKVKELDESEAKERESVLNKIRQDEVNNIISNKENLLNKLTQYEQERKKIETKFYSIDPEMQNASYEHERNALEKNIALTKTLISETENLVAKAEKFRFRRKGSVIESPGAGNGGGGISEIDRREEEAKRIEEQQRRQSIGELARLKEDYEQRKALLEEYGLSTIHLTYNYEQKVKEITDKYADESLKALQEKLKKQEEEEKKAKKQRYDEFMSVVNDEANQELIKWDTLLNANKVGSLQYENEMVSLNLERLQKEYEFLSKSENQTEDSEKRKTEIIKEQLKERKKLNNINYEIAKEGMDVLGSMMGSFAGLAKENSKAQKAFAITEVIINTVSASIAAVKGAISTFGVPVGPIIGAAQSAALAASGAVAIKNIKNADKGGGESGTAAVAQAVAPDPISLTRNVLTQSDIQLQKETMSGINPVVSVVDIEKQINRSQARVSESSF